MADRLGALIDTIVKQNTEDGYKDSGLLVLLVLKKILAQNPDQFGNQEQLSQQQESELIDV